nr:MAG TPA: hypothetical protein [Caudoviricetes sp.]
MRIDCEQSIIYIFVSSIANWFAKINILKLLFCYSLLIR